METSLMMFLDCPEYTDTGGARRCGLPAEIQDRYVAAAAGGPLESVRIRCPLGHWFNGPVQLLALPRQPARDGKRPARSPR